MAVCGTAQLLSLIVLIFTASVAGTPAQTNAARSPSVDLNGLLVAQMAINNWDLKSSNNKIYEVSGTTAAPRRWYVVRDLGASFGENEQSKWIRWLGIRGAQGSKNDLEGFEKSGFIDKVENGRVKFSYSGPNKPLLSHITTEDVRSTAQLLSRISDQQWQDAFRAAAYSPADSARFIAKIKEKITQGLALNDAGARVRSRE